MKPEDAGQHEQSGLVAIVTDSTTYLPRELIERDASDSQPLCRMGGRSAAREHYQDLDAFYARLHASPKLPTTSQPSIGDFLAVYRPLVCRQGRPLDPHRGGPLGHLRRAPESRQAPRRGGSRRARDVHDARPEPAAWASWFSSLRDCRRAGREPRGQYQRRRAESARHLVLPRHARVPAPRRSNRRGSGVDRDGPENQADPDVWKRNRARRASPHASPRNGAHGRVTSESCTPAARATGSSSTLRRRPTRSAWSRPAQSCSAAGRCSARRSGRCLAHISEPAYLWAALAKRPRCRQATRLPMPACPDARRGPSRRIKRERGRR